MRTVVWIVGRSGLLGQAIAREVNRRADTIILNAPAIDWGDADSLGRQAETTASYLVSKSEAQGMRWCVVWAAGAAVTSASEQDVALELSAFRAFVAAIAVHASGHESRGSFFLASSAGGVYGATSCPPFTEDSQPSPLSPYGRLKLNQESIASELANLGLPVLIGRITNLYGPGQRLEKMQGIISHLVLARLGGRPVSIFVPLETVRDYLYVDDCATLIMASLERLVRESNGQGLAVVKIMGAGYGVTLSRLLGYAQSVGKGRNRAVLGASAQAVNHAPDLRVRSIVWPDLDRFEKTSLPSGFQSTIQGVLSSIQERPVHM